jgi:hypothetical protein
MPILGPDRPFFGVSGFTKGPKDRRKLLFEHAIATIISNGANSSQGWRAADSPSVRVGGKQEH